MFQSRTILFLTFSNTFLCLAFQPSGFPRDIYHHTEILGGSRKFLLEWEYFPTNESIQFDISAESKEYVGLGLSRDGLVQGSDFVVGGVNSTGEPYFYDMHGMKDGRLAIDKIQNWQLISAQKSENRTQFVFSRDLISNDKDDTAINDDLLYLLWFSGDTTQLISTLPSDFGVLPVYLLDPASSTPRANFYYKKLYRGSNNFNMQLWSAVTTQMVPVGSSKICSIVKGPEKSGRNYVLGGGIYSPFQIPNPALNKIILKRCSPSNETYSSGLFNQLINNSGFSCHSSSFATQNCQDALFVMGKGSKPYYFPEPISYHIGDSLDEYYLIEAHYTRPEIDPSPTKVKTGFQLIFHPTLREHQSSILTIGGPINLSFPNSSSGIVISQHCKSDCINKMLGEKESARTFAVMMAMKSSGKASKIRHYRNATELPIILQDWNYSGLFQQIRELRNEVEIFKDDQISVDCVFQAPKMTLGIQEYEECTAYLFMI